MNNRTRTHVIDQPIENSQPISSTAPPPANRRGPRLIHAVLLLLVLANIACLGYYLFHGYQYYFHSDSAAANLLAQEIHETGQYFPQDWNYVNGDLWVVMVQTWILLLFPFFKNGYALHAAAGVIGCILIGLATWGLCAILGMRTRTKLFTLALLSAGMTPIMSEHIFGQQAYGTSFYISCAILICGWKFVQTHGTPAWAWAACTAVLVILVAWANPQRAVLSFVLPLLGGMAVLYGALHAAPEPARAQRRRLGLLLVIALLAMVTGTLLYRSTLSGNMGLGAKLAIHWLAFPLMAENIMRLLHGLVALLGGTPAPGTRIATPIAMVEALRMVAGLAVIAIAPYALVRSLRSAHPGLAFTAGAAAASLGSSLFIFMTTTLSTEGSPDQTVRYLVPGVLLTLLVLVAFLQHDKRVGMTTRLTAGVALAVLTLSAPIAYELLNIPGNAAAGGAERVIPKLRLVQFLKSEKLGYGYSTFWHANQVTVLSEGKVAVRQVTFTNGMPLPMRHLSSNRWYEPGAWKGPTFLMLTKDEAAGVDLTEMFKVVGEPTRRLAFEDFRIFVFDHNIARDFPGWHLRITKPVQYPSTASTPHTIGRFDEATRSLSAEQGAAGYLRFGPYQHLQGGRYLVTFDIRTEGSEPNNFGTVDISADNGKRILASRAVERAGAQRITVPLVFEGLINAAEFRVFSTGAGKMNVMNVELANDDRRK